MIEKLTKDQESKIPFYFEKWKKIGLEYSEIDVEEAKKRLSPYLLIGNIQPKYFLKFSSPMMCQLAINVLKNLNNDLGSQLSSQLSLQLGSQFSSQLYSQLYLQLYLQLYSQLDSQLGTQLRTQLYSQLYSQLSSQLDSQLDSQLSSQLSKIKLDYYSSYYWSQSGNVVSGYCAFYDFLMNEVKKLDVPWDVFTNVTSYLHYFWTFKDFVFLTEKPKSLKFNSKNQLHCEDGLACEYNDGWGLYSLNGVSVPEYVVKTKPEQFDCNFLLKEKNAEVRREIVRKVGIDLICQRLNAKIMDKKDNYELINLDLGDDSYRPYLKMLNPSIGVWHVEGVHPNCRTVEDALNFRNGTLEKPIILT